MVRRLIAACVAFFLSTFAVASACSLPSTNVTYLSCLGMMNAKTRTINFAFGPEDSGSRCVHQHVDGELSFRGWAKLIGNFWIMDDGENIGRVNANTLEYSFMLGGKALGTKLGMGWSPGMSCAKSAPPQRRL